MFKKVLCSLLSLLLLMTIPLVAMGQEVDPEGLAIEFLTLLETGKNEEAFAKLTPDVQKALPLEQLSAIMPQLTVQAGAYQQKIEITKSAEANGLTTIDALMIMEAKDIIAQVIIDKDGLVAGIWFNFAAKVATDEVLPEGITQEIVDFQSGDYVMHGTLTLPANATGKLPVLVFVHGSGQNDRDESVGGTKLFKDLAWGLASRGYATLRYDKRTLTYGAEIGQGDMASFTVWEETVQDAISAAAFLRGDERLDGDRVYMLGHSMGAMLAPRIAQQGECYNGLVMMAGTPQALWQVLLDQNNAGLAKMSAEDQAKYKPMIAAEEEKALALGTMTPEEAKKSTVFGMGAWYLKEMDSYDAGEIAKVLELPMLIMQGEKDFQVSAAKDFVLWQEVLSGKDTVEFKLYPKLNHLFMEYTGDASLAGTVDEYNTPANADAQVVEDIANWLDGLK